MIKLLEHATSGLLVVAAIAVAAVQVHRELAAPPPVESRHSEFVSDWQSMVASAHVLGPKTAPITIVEFTDLQCPYCRRFNTTLSRLRQEYPDQIAAAIIDFPLEMHPFAEPAARAVECAANEGQFASATDFVFANQDSLGKRPWTWFAQGAGIRDTTRFAECMSTRTTAAAVAAGQAIGFRAKVLATPTIILNGWRYGVVPSDTELTRAVRDLLAGRTPYKDFKAVGLPRRGSN